nr:MAG TPA: hypothetical protein [Caudoviricetes sp.]
MTKVPHFFGFHGSFSAFSPDVQRVIAQDLEPACCRRRRTLDLSLPKVGRSFVILPAFAYEEYAKLVISQLYSVENETKEKIMP